MNRWQIKMCETISDTAIMLFINSVTSGEPLVSEYNWHAI